MGMEKNRSGECPQDLQADRLGKNGKDESEDQDEMGSLKEESLGRGWAKVGDYDFKVDHIEFQVALGFSSEALQLVFAGRDTDFRKERLTLEVRSHNL